MAEPPDDFDFSGVDRDGGGVSGRFTRLLREVPDDDDDDEPPDDRLEPTSPDRDEPDDDDDPDDPEEPDDEPELELPELVVPLREVACPHAGLASARVIAADSAVWTGLVIRMACSPGDRES